MLALACGCPSDETPHDDPMTTGDASSDGGSTGPTQGSSSSGGDSDASTGAGSGATSSDGGSSSTAADTTGAGSSSDGSTGAAPDDGCAAYCDVVAACNGADADECVATCETFRQFRAENFDAACQAATVETQGCTAMLTCAELDAFACDDARGAEVAACSAGALPQPGLQAFCTMVMGCSQVTYDLCVADLLEWSVADTYQLGCAEEFEALLACNGGLTCEQYADQEVANEICAAEIAAFETACPTFGRG